MEILSFKNLGLKYVNFTDSIIIKVHQGQVLLICQLIIYPTTIRFVKFLSILDHVIIV